ncbi:Hypoxanthine-guanine phosphoribosyltransferase [Bacteroidales bacterium Barb6XT]|nr:Hypoxanthine-guanine phosphoribosyltransferase [Bacteroidales bacterium Barb6XT]
MDKISLNGKEFELFLSEKQIKEAIKAMAERIRVDMEGINPVFVSILNGAFMFTAELMRQLDGPYELVFARYSSYKGTATTGKVMEIMPITTDISGRTIVLLEDIVDTGTTMQYVINKLKQEGTTDVRLATMLFKPETLECDLTPDYVGLEIPPDFIVGYGLDYNGTGRTFKDIYKLVADK